MFLKINSGAIDLAPRQIRYFNLIYCSGVASTEERVRIKTLVLFKPCLESFIFAPRTFLSDILQFCYYFSFLLVFHSYRSHARCLTCVRWRYKGSLFLLVYLVLTSETLLFNDRDVQLQKYWIMNRYNYNYQYCTLTFSNIIIFEWYRKNWKFVCMNLLIQLQITY